MYPILIIRNCLQALSQRKADMVCILGILLGIWMRLDQILDQVLIDDEWHAVHAIISLGGIKEIILSFGVADHSIPLTLLYWMESSWFGLSELGMRWPMLLCGILTLVLFVLYVRHYVGGREAALFSMLLGLSPLLVSYSRTARPYAITLLLVYLSVFAVEKFCRNHSGRIFYAYVYILSGVLAVWMHLISVGFIVAPLIIEIISSIRHADKLGSNFRLRRSVILGVCVSLGILLVVLPPLWATPEVISNKVGMNYPNWQTFSNVWYSWFGVASNVVVLAFIGLGIIGGANLWGRLWVFRVIGLGTVITVALIIAMRPALVHYPIVFGRYVLPIVPLLLLSVSVGTVRLVDFGKNHIHFLSQKLAVAIYFLPIVMFAWASPVWKMHYHPNTVYTAWRLDFEHHEDMIPKRVDRFPLSSYWTQVSKLPKNSLRIAVAPWYFNSYDWDAPRWESVGGQTIVPGYLTGLCVGSRLGETPHEPRFDLRNAVFLNDADDIPRKRINSVIYQKFYVGAINYSPDQSPADCEAALRSRFGYPAYEDDEIIVFSLTN